MTVVSNVGKWDRWYCRGQEEPQPYGNTITYQLAADYLDGCDLIEDWGCGKGWFSTFIPPDRYRGIDGSQTPWAGVVADLTDYRSDVPGVFMRHVLEHNYRWSDILANAVESFRERFVLVLFTPLVDQTHEVAYNDDPGVPDIAFSLADIADHLTGLTWSHETILTDTLYKAETIFLVERS